MSALDANMMLSDLVRLIQEGKPMSPEYGEQLESVLSHWQAKIDLVQIGITVQQISRTSDLAQKIDMVEGQVFGPEGVNLLMMEDKDKIRLMGLLMAEYRDTVNFLGNRSSKPTITSSETMKKVPSASLGQQESSRLPAESRNKVRGVLTRMLARMATDTTLEAEIIPPTAT